MVHKTILEVSKSLGQEVLAIAVYCNHVHIVLNNINMTISQVAAKYKRAASKILNDNGLKGKVWTKGYDKRFCFDSKSLNARISCVDRHLDGLV